MVYTVIESFEWDPRKAEANFAKHGVTFETAITAFDDHKRWFEQDLKHSTPEEIRERLIGRSDVGILMIVYTIRNPGFIGRIISARKASRCEKRNYEQRTGV